MKKKTVKYIAFFTLIIALLVAVFLAFLPTLVKQQVETYYANNVPEGVLTIEDVGINLFTGKLLLKGVSATSKQNSVLRLGQFNADISVKDLLSKNIHIQTLKLSDFHVLIERKNNQITVAGYALPNAEPEKEKVSEPFSLQGLGIEQLDVHAIELNHVSATLNGEYIDTTGVIRSLTLNNIHSNHTQPVKMKADVQLNTLAIKPTKNAPITAQLNQPATLLVQGSIKNLFDNPDANIQSTIKLNQLHVEHAQTRVNINRPTKLTFNADIKHALDNPSAGFNMSLVAPDVRYQNNTQHVQLGVGALNLNGAVTNLLKQASLTTQVGIKKFNWDVQLDKTQAFTGAFEAVAVPKLSVALGDKRTQAWFKDAPLKTLSFSNLTLTQLKNKTTLPSVLMADATVNALSMSGFDVLNPASSTEIKADVKVNALDYSVDGESKRISLEPSATLVVQASIKNLNAPTVNADAKAKGLVVKANGLDDTLLNLNEADLKGVSLSNLTRPHITIDQIDLNQMAFMGESNPLVKLSSNVKGVTLQNNQLTVDDVVLNDVSSNMVFAPQYKITKVEQLLNYFSPKTSDSKQVAPQSEFKVRVKRIHTTGNNLVRIKDATLQPAIQHELRLKKVDIKNINTANAQAATVFDVDVNVSQYSDVALAGHYTLFAKKPSGQVKGKLDNIDLLNYNTYLTQAIGYKATTGALSMDVDLAVNQAELSGGVDVLLNNLELSPSNPDKIESLKKQLSMPLDQSLSLLKDKQGKINVNLPLSGNINAPDFSLSGVMTLVTKKALKTATVVGIKQMIQPYGSLLTIGEWAGDKLLAVKLDPIEYGYGETQVGADKIPYLDKVVEIMKNKDALNLKLCAKISQEEAEFAMLKPEALLPIANQRSANVRAYLVEKGGLPAGRILQCESEVSDKNKPYSWLDLEI